MSGRSGFDKLAGVYRWMEAVSFGPMLQRCRVQFLPQMAGARRALVLGDGDGRFCAALLRSVPRVQVVAVDASARMLHRLCWRVERDGNGERLWTVHGSALEVLPPGEVDVVCTHFFLDCLSDAEVRVLAAKVRQRCRGGQWAVSEFAIPRGPAGWWAAAVVQTLYAAFGVLAGLRVQRLPDYAGALRENGFVLEQARVRMCGLLRAELWRAAQDADS